jgi:hypothetical protein
VAATNLEDSAGRALSAVSFQRSASVLSFLRDFFAKSKEVTEKEAICPKMIGLKETPKT